MNEFLAAIAAHQWIIAVIVGVPVLLRIARMISPFLDVTRLPAWAQPIVPFLGVALPTIASQLSSGTPVADAILVSVEAGLASIGGYHVAKPLAKPKAPPAKG